MTPTARSLQALRRDGYEAAVVEKWLPYCRRRADLFGCIDILAVKYGEPVLAVQATSAANVSSRLSKSLAEPRLRIWLGSGQRFEVWGWSKRGPRGKRKTWQLVRREVGLGDLVAG